MLLYYIMIVLLILYIFVYDKYLSFVQLQIFLTFGHFRL